MKIEAIIATAFEENLKKIFHGLNITVSNQMWWSTRSLKVLCFAYIIQFTNTVNSDFQFTTYRNIFKVNYEKILIKKTIT